jgi:hypothetical protein
MERLMTDKREVAIQAWARWIRRYQWSWFCTLKVTGGIPSERRAKQLFGQWIKELKESEGGPRFRWVRVLERGPIAETLHFHVLVGGLRKRHLKWGERWEEIGGNALISTYDDTRDGVLYMLKEMNAAGDLDIDFKLPNSAEEVKTGRPPRSRK